MAHSRVVPSFRSIAPMRTRGIVSSLSSSSSITSSLSSSTSSSLSSSIPSYSPLSSPSLPRHFSSYSFNAPNPFLSHNSASQMHSTTILTVRKNNEVVVIGDGQVSLGSTVVKGNAKKVRRIDNGRVIVGFAGSTADCFTLMDRLEKKMEEYPGQLLRASVELAKEWRSDKYLRQLEAWMIACDKDLSVTITGNGDVLSDPGHGVMGIGSGSLYAVAAARALIPIEGLKAKEIGERAMKIAADICVYTNGNFVIETFEADQQTSTNNANNAANSGSSSSTNSSTSSSSPSSPSASSPDPKMF